jgi:hypothetical protein
LFLRLPLHRHPIHPTSQVYSPTSEHFFTQDGLPQYFNHFTANSVFAVEEAVKMADHHGAIHESHEPEKMSVGRYIATRLPTLKPPMHKAPNPITLIRMLNTKQWMFFLVGFLAWVCPSLFLKI